MMCLFECSLAKDYHHRPKYPQLLVSTQNALVNLCSLVSCLYYKNRSVDVWSLIGRLPVLLGWGSGDPGVTLLEPSHLYTRINIM